MKKKELVQIVTDNTAGFTPEDVNEPALQLTLMQAGASAAQIARELPKALVALGLRISPAVRAKDADKHIKKGALRKAAKSSDSFTTYLSELSTTAEEPVDYMSKRVKVFAKLQDPEITLPKRSGLGKVKTAMVSYFASTPTEEQSLKSMAAYLEGTGMTEEKALHAARMNFTFCVAVRNA